MASCAPPRVRHDGLSCRRRRRSAASASSPHAFTCGDPAPRRALPPPPSGPLRGGRRARGDLATEKSSRPISALYVSALVANLEHLRRSPGVSYGARTKLMSRSVQRTPASGIGGGGAAAGRAAVAVELGGVAQPAEVVAHGRAGRASTAAAARRRGRPRRRCRRCRRGVVVVTGAAAGGRRRGALRRRRAHLLRAETTARSLPAVSTSSTWPSALRGRAVGRRRRTAAATPRARPRARASARHSPRTAAAPARRCGTRLRGRGMPLHSRRGAGR